MNLSQNEREIALKLQTGEALGHWRTVNQVLSRLRRRGLVERVGEGHKLTSAGVEALSRENAPTLTRAQRRVLELARDESGGSGPRASVLSCRRRGWLDASDEITPAGRAALEGT